MKDTGQCVILRTQRIKWLRKRVLGWASNGGMKERISETNLRQRILWISNEGPPSPDTWPLYLTANKSKDFGPQTLMDSLPMLVTAMFLKFSCRAKSQTKGNRFPSSSGAESFISWNMRGPMPQKIQYTILLYYYFFIQYYYEMDQIYESRSLFSLFWQVLLHYF